MLPGMIDPLGVLVMAYGTADGPDDIERYYTDIRGGRSPSPELLAELRERYREIGDRFPLLDITRAQAEGLQRELDAVQPGAFRTYLGMKHSPPWITDAVDEMRRDGIRRAIGIVMAPHWSAMSIGSYRERVQRAQGEDEVDFTMVERFDEHPLFIDLLRDRLERALATLDPLVRDEAAVVFTAHSLPVRTLDDGTLRCKTCDACADGCRYAGGLRATAERVALELGIDEVLTAWQSAGRTPDPWWGPPLEEVIADLAAAGRSAVVVCSAGFVADHLEILYDLDVEARALAEGAGMAFARTEMPNADPAYTRMLAAVVRECVSDRA
jgi:ferrochelatase